MSGMECEGEPTNRRRKISEQDEIKETKRSNKGMDRSERKDEIKS